MLAFWPDVVRPLLRALEPKTIVEIGSESGKTTLRLLELAREIGATVHAVDPAPLFDVDAWRRDHGEHLVLHLKPSLAVLDQLGPFDAVLIDGDHNWYTVYNELRLVERRSRELGAAMPLILLHDVAWPYGRRDLYYQPESIPEADRQPYARRGISPTESELLDQGGYNAHLCNAEREGGPRNGVLTAVEDYLKQSQQQYLVARIPAAFGLGILLPAQLAAERPQLERLVKAWTVAEVERFIGRLEMARIAVMTGLAR